MKNIWFAALVTCSLNGVAQQDFRISHGELADVYRNPAKIGSESSLSVFVLHRRQWVDLPGGPNTTLIGISNRLSNKIGGSVGVQLIDDKIGNLRFNAVKFIYAKDFRFGISELRIGLGLHGNFLKENNDDWITSDSGIDSQLNTTSITKGQFVDGSFGVSFKRNDFSFGLAGAKLRKVSLKEVNWKSARSYNSWVGYKIQWGNKIALNSTPMLRMIADEQSKPQYEVRLDTEINNRYWLLAGYRLNESVLLGFSFTAPVGVGKMIISYVFDYSLNQLAEYNSGSHELMLRFNLNKIEVNEKKDVKNVRFL